MLLLLLPPPPPLPHEVVSMHSLNFRFSSFLMAARLRRVLGGGKGGLLSTPVSFSCCGWWTTTASVADDDGFSNTGGDSGGVSNCDDALDRSDDDLIFVDGLSPPPDSPGQRKVRGQS